MAGLLKPEKGGTPKQITTKNKPGSTGPWGDNPARNWDKNQSQDMGDDGSVSPEEQKQYDQFVKNGMNLIYDEGGLGKIVESLKGGENPIGGLANTLVSVVSRLEDSAEQNKQQISGDVLYHGGVELMEQLAEMAEAAKIHEFSEEDLESALYLALDQYRAMRQEQGKLPEERLKADFQTMLQAENEGRLDEILPGIEEYAQKAPQGQQEE